MKTKLLLISIFILGTLVLTAIYIVFGTLSDFRASQAMGEYTQTMYVRDMAYIRLHKIPITYLGIILFSLGYIVRVVLEAIFKKGE